MRYFNLKPFYFEITHGANAFCKIFSRHIEGHISDDTPYKNWRPCSQNMDANLMIIKFHKSSFTRLRHYPKRSKAFSYKMKLIL